MTPDVAKAVTEFKAGKVEYRTDRYGNVHVPLGKVSFGRDALAENYSAVLDELLRAKPASAKGRYLRSVSLSSTMGPGVKVDPNRAKLEEHDRGRDRLGSRPRRFHAADLRSPLGAVMGPPAGRGDPDRPPPGPSVSCAAPGPEREDVSQRGQTREGGGGRRDP